MEILFLVITGLLVFLVWNHFHWQADPWPEGALQIPRFQAHRGDRQFGARENSMEAFRQAKKSGAPMIELDVRLSADAQAIVFHDGDLKRLYRDESAVQKFTAAELKTRFQIPSLEEVLRDPDSPSFVNIEIKSTAYRDSRLEKAVIDVIRRTQSQSRVLMSSFNPLSLWRFRRLAPEIPRALLATREAGPGYPFYLQRLWLAPYVHPHLLHLDYRYVTPAQLENFRRRKIPVALWTMNDQKQTAEFFSAGVVSLISDSIYKN